MNKPFQPSKWCLLLIGPSPWYGWRLGLSQPPHRDGSHILKQRLGNHRMCGRHFGGGNCPHLSQTLCIKHCGKN